MSISVNGGKINGPSPRCCADLLSIMRRSTLTMFISSTSLSLPQGLEEKGSSHGCDTARCAPMPCNFRKTSRPRALLPLGSSRSTVLPAGCDWLQPLEPDGGGSARLRQHRKSANRDGSPEGRPLLLPCCLSSTRRADGGSEEARVVEELRLAACWQAAVVVIKPARQRFPGHKPLTSLARQCDGLAGTSTHCSWILAASRSSQDESR